MKKTVEEKIQHIVFEQLGVDPAEVTQDADIMNDLGADSLEFIELVMVLEEEFGIDIPD